MSSDYWEPNNMVFVHLGMRYSVLPNTLKTVCIGSVEDLNKPAEPVAEQPKVKVVTVHKIRVVEEPRRQRGRPPVAIKEQQLSFLSMPGLSIRQRAKAMGVSPTKAYQLVKAAR